MLTKSPRQATSCATYALTGIAVLCFIEYRPVLVPSYFFVGIWRSGHGRNLRGRRQKGEYSQQP
jgi:hypothetical protein